MACYTIGGDLGLFSQHADKVSFTRARGEIVYKFMHKHNISCIKDGSLCYRVEMSATLEDVRWLTCCSVPLSDSNVN